LDGAELRADKRGAIPDHRAAIVERLGLNRSSWAEIVLDYGRQFKQAAGIELGRRCRSSLAGRRSQGKETARTAFL
jgi:hypothetical protein